LVLPTKSVPLAPHVIARAFGTRATTSIVNPGGSLRVSSGQRVLRTYSGTDRCEKRRGDEHGRRGLRCRPSDADRRSPIVSFKLLASWLEAIIAATQPVTRRSKLRAHPDRVNSTVQARFLPSPDCDPTS
jgi:hypothetical protein